jgi:formate hydrogenlyase subunit 4
MVGKMVAVAVAAARYDTGSFNFNDIVNNLKQAMFMLCGKLHVLTFFLCFIFEVGGCGFLFFDK